MHIALLFRWNVNDYMQPYYADDGDPTDRLDGVVLLCDCRCCHLQFLPCQRSLERNVSCEIRESGPAAESWRRRPTQTSPCVWKPVLAGGGMRTPRAERHHVEMRHPRTYEPRVPGRFRVRREFLE